MPIASRNSSLKQFVPPFGDPFERGFVLKRGKVSPGAVPGAWDYEIVRGEVVVFLNCPWCGKITSKRGTMITVCLVCNKCDKHLWVRFSGIRSALRRESKR